MDGMAEERVQTVAGMFVGLLVTTVIGVKVVIPVIMEGIADAGIGGTTESVLGLLPLFIAMYLLLKAARPVMG